MMLRWTAMVTRMRVTATMMTMVPLTHRGGVSLERGRARPVIIILLPHLPHPPGKTHHASPHSMRSGGDNTGHV
jgi:hypothetical protein